MIDEFKKVAGEIRIAPVIPVIRPEEPADADAIHRVHARAFPTPAEAELVRALRAAGAIELGLVAELGGQVVGHIVFSAVTIETPGASKPSRGLGLAPVAVLGTAQKKGLGRALISTGLDRARAAGHRLCVVLGDPAYYGRFGFVPAHTLGLWCTFEVPREAFQALELVKGASPSGLVKYRPELEAMR